MTPRETLESSMLLDIQESSKKGISIAEIVMKYSDYPQKNVLKAIEDLRQSVRVKVTDEEIVLPTNAEEKISLMNRSHRRAYYKQVRLMNKRLASHKQ